jgi:hypothetical protein
VIQHYDDAIGIREAQNIAPPARDEVRVYEHDGVYAHRDEIAWTNTRLPAFARENLFHNRHSHGGVITE